MKAGFFERVVMVRTKHELFYARVTGEWTDKRFGLDGPIVTTPGGRSFEIDYKRIVCFDDGEVPFWEAS